MTANEHKIYPIRRGRETESKENRKITEKSDVPFSSPSKFKGLGATFPIERVTDEVPSLLNYPRLDIDVVVFMRSINLLMVREFQEANLLWALEQKHAKS